MSATAPAVARTLRTGVRSRVAGQTVVYTLAGGGSMALSGIAAALLARQMTPATFGSYSFARSLLMLLALVFDFGIFVAAARLIARAEPVRHRELLGAALLLLLPLAACFGWALFGLSFVVDGVFDAQAKTALQVCAPLAIAWTFANMGETLAKGAGRLHVFSLSLLVARGLMVAALVVILLEDLHVSTTLAVLLESASLGVGLVMFAVWLRPVWRRAGEHARAISHQVRAWAFQVYIGGFLSIGTYNMDVLMVASFSDAQSTGYYALAGALTAALGLPMVGLGAALYPRMARQGHLERSWLLTAWAWGALGILVIAAGGPAFVALVFSESYSDVAVLALPLAAAQAVRGVTTIYVNFMSAQGHGRDMRNAALVLTVANVVFNLALIPPFGATGAAWASLAALSLNYLAYRRAYGRHVTAGGGPVAEAYGS